MNAAGTEGRPGGISGKTLVYQQWRGRRSDIELLDLITRKRSKPPKGVNTRQSESRPSLSGNWLLFNRFNRRTKLQLVLLRNLRTGRQIELARARPPEHVLAAQIQGQYAVWTACRFRCGVLRYDIATHTRLAVPTSPIPEASDYAGAVTSDGTVYVTRRFSLSCKPGSDVLLLRFRPTDGQLTPLTRFQAGQVPTSLFATSEDGSPVVYFDRGPCGQPGDIYKVIEFAGPPPERQARNED